MDDKLSWHNEAHKVPKNVNQRLYCIIYICNYYFLNKLHYCQVDRTILSLFYQSCILSLFNFCLPAWGGNAKDVDSRNIDICLKNAGKLIDQNIYHTLETIFVKTMFK